MARPKLRAAMMLAIGFLSAGLILASTPAHAVTFNLTSDHCTGGCGLTPFGTVELTQSGTTVDVTVTMLQSNLLIKTGSADFQWFKFNATGVVVGDITVDQTAPKPLAAAAGTFNGNGTGDFAFAIGCPTCSNGNSGDGFAGPLTFHVANAVIADLTNPNANGNIFVADIFNPLTGNTGPVDVSGPPVAAAEPGTLLLLGSALVGIGAWSRRRMGVPRAK